MIIAQLELGPPVIYAYGKNWTKKTYIDNTSGQKEIVNLILTHSVR